MAKRITDDEAVATLRSVVGELTSAQSRSKDLERERDTLIVSLLHEGHSTREVAAVAHVTQARIVQINNQYAEREPASEMEGSSEVDAVASQ